MSTLLSFVSVWEFLLRYTVIFGIVVAAIGVAICMLAKRITMFKRRTDEINKNDKLYQGLLIAGICVILLGLILIALPIENTFYKG